MVKFMDKFLYIRTIDDIIMGHDRDGGPRCLVLPVYSIDDIPASLRDTPEKTQKFKEIFFLE
jgi:hypothetical protein